MVFLSQNIGRIILMLLLLGGSAFFSGSETAFFNLSRRQVKLLQDSKHKLQNLVGRLLARPRQLLGSLLFGNMVVNVLFFAVTSIFVVKIEQQIGAGAAAATAFASFCLLVLFGEVLPKSVAYTSSKSLSVTAALPAYLIVRIFSPVVSVMRVLITEPVLRLLLGPSRPTKAITTSEFKLLIEQIRRRGLISADENKLLGEIIEFGFLKVRHVMRPRVDMIACAVTDSAQTAQQKMVKNRMTKLAVYRGTIDNIVGLVYLRRLLLAADKPLDELVQEVHFVPEQKTVESLLEFFRKTGIDIAIVVDEYGGIAGSVCLEDIAEELLGPIEVTDIKPIEQIGPFEYRLSGDMAIHDWAGAFGIDLTETRVSTIAGLVTALLGKIPKGGDVTRLGNLKFTIERVRKRRIETVILNLESIIADD